MTDHPSQFALEAYSVGEHDDAVAAHLADCEACRRVIEELAASQRRFLDEESAENFLSRPAISAELQREASSPRALPWTSRLKRLWVPLALAAVALIVVINLPQPTHVENPNPRPDDIIMKGKGTLRLIVSRRGEQRVLQHPATLEVGDAIRVSLEIDAPGPWRIGVLETDGTWTELLPPTSLKTRRAFSPADGLTVQSRETAGWVIAGHPDKVEAAKRSRDFSQVLICRFATTP